MQVFRIGFVPGLPGTLASRSSKVFGLLKLRMFRPSHIAMTAPAPGAGNDWPKGRSLSTEGAGRRPEAGRGGADEVCTDLCARQGRGRPPRNPPGFSSSLRSHSPSAPPPDAISPRSTVPGFFLVHAGCFPPGQSALAPEGPPVRLTSHPIDSLQS